MDTLPAYLTFFISVIFFKMKYTFLLTTTDFEEKQMPVPKDILSYQCVWGMA